MFFFWWGGGLGWVGLDILTMIRFVTLYKLLRANPKYIKALLFAILYLSVHETNISILLFVTTKNQMKSHPVLKNQD